MNPDYSRTAPFYDRLSRVIFGNALINAQVYLLKHIEPGTRVIIIGGGTGWILEKLSQLHPSGLLITYVEIADKMMKRSMGRFTGTNEVVFIKDDVKHVKVAVPYDVVITPFLFDNFSQENAASLFTHINSLIKPEGLWLDCDFQLTGKRWQKMLLTLMLLFFRLLSKVEARKLPNIAVLFAELGYTLSEQATFYGDFIIARVHHRPNY